MREATATAFALHQGPVERWAVAAWAGLCLGVGCAGLARHVALAAEMNQVSLVATAAGLLGGGVTMVLAWWAMPTWHWHLEWQGSTCRLTPVDDPAGAAEGAVHPMLDLGGWMLLRFNPADGRPVRWLAASARQLGPGWHGLRSALFRPDNPSAAARRG